MDTRKNNPEVLKKASKKFRDNNPEKNKIFGIKNLPEETKERFKSIQKDTGLTAPELLFLLLDKFEDKK